MNENKNLYSITLKPYRSLSKIGFILLMVVLCTFCFVTGIMFIKIGAWPVFGFFGLDVLLVYIFFKINFKSGKKKERILLTSNQLIIEFYESQKIVKTYFLNPNWLKINLIQLKNQTSKLQISSINKAIIIGSFLRYQEKKKVIELLQKVLKQNHFNFTNVNA